MSSRPKPSMYEQLLLQQRLAQQQSLANEQQAYSAAAAADRAAAASRVAANTAATEENVQKATKRPVSLGTILTSPVGIFGNPTLSGTKLSG